MAQDLRKDKDKGWEPTPKQAQFLSLPYEIKEGMYGGGAGSGKSDVLLYYPIVHGWHEHPRFKQLFLRRTIPEIRREIVPRAKLIYKRFGAKYNDTQSVFTFPSGALVVLGHCEHEDDVHKYDSMEINLFTPDEVTSLTEFIYTYIGFTRVRSSDRALPALIRCAGMPGNIGHSFFKKRFVDPAPKGGVIIEGRGVKRVYVHATVVDNPNADPDYIRMLDSIPSEAERNAKKYGSWEAYLGEVFSEFRDRRYPDEPDNANHVCDEFEIPAFWPKVVVGDWGFSAMNYVLYLAISPDRRVYAYREQFWLKTKIEEWAPYVRQLIEKENPKAIKFCRSVSKETGSEHTIQEQIETALGRPIDLANHSPGSRISGKMLIHEYLRWKQKHIPSREMEPFDEEKAAKLLRNYGLAQYKQYIDSFNPQPEEKNLPKLQIFKTCPELIKAIKMCFYAKPKEGNVAEDVAEFLGDDPYDTLRYGLDEADKFFTESENEFLNLQRRQAIVGELEKTGDYTKFYMQARVMEQKQLNAPVRRYHHK